MKTENERLARLVALARRGRPVVDESPATPHPGFATRVAARWGRPLRTLSAVEAWERVSWWGSGLATAACLIVLTFHRPAPESTGFDLLLGESVVHQSY